MPFTLNQLVIFAARGGNLDLLKERVESGGDINYFDSNYGSALTAAIGNGNICIIDYLIENGANLNAENAHGIVPLEMALHHASDDIVRKLAMSGAKLNSRSRPHWRERLVACLNDY